MPKFQESALSSYRALVAEAATALAVERLAGGQAIIRGGRCKGADVIGPDRSYLVDAKALTPMTASERREWPGCSYKFARQDHALFTDEVTHIGLVQLDKAGSRARITAGGALSALAQLDKTVVSLIPVDDMNDALDPVGGAEHGWRYVVVDDSLLASHVVS